LILNANALHVPLADESVGMVLTSPPYNVGLKYDGFNDNITEGEHQAFTRLWLAEAYRVTEDTGRLYAIIGDKMMWWFRELAEVVGWSFVQLLMWCKPNMVSRAKFVMGDWLPMSENILLFRKGKRVPMMNGKANTFNWTVATVPQSNFNGGRIHPAQLPVTLCAEIISRTPGNPVLDPFCGSGSVMVAAKKLGRSFVGFDLVWPVTVKAKRRVDMTNKPLFKQKYQQAEFDEVSI